VDKKMVFKIATWNVNSLRVRLPQVLTWLESAKPDILALQETKVLDADFPIAAINAAGYEVIFSGQPTYNGVAILSREKGRDIVCDLPEFDDLQRRVLAATYSHCRVINLYIPNGENLISAKYEYKLAWLEKLTVFLKAELAAHSKIIILGDFNIAPADEDVHDPKAWVGQVLCSKPERAAFQAMIALGFHDCFRLVEQAEKSFSWWDYRLNSFKRNRGLRIDHILASTGLRASFKQCMIDKEPRGWERPSDHTPVIAEFEI
jgi:exodeoxyribonuclease-3